MFTKRTKITNSMGYVDYETEKIKPFDIGISWPRRQKHLKDIGHEIRNLYGAHYEYEKQTNDKGVEYVHTARRCAYKTAQTHLHVLFHSPSLKKRTKWHSSVINENKHKIQTFTDGMAPQYDLKNDDKYFEFEKMIVLITGDGVRMCNVPKITQDVSIASLRFPMLRKSIFFSKNSMAVFYITTLGHELKRIRQSLYCCLKSLYLNSFFKMWNEENKCFMVMKYDMYHTGDWAWLSSVWFGSIQAGGTYCLVELVVFREGIPEMIPFHFGELVKAFLAPKMFPNEIPTLEQCENTKINGYAITNEEIYQHFADKIEDARAQHGPFANDVDEEKWERQTSKNQHHGVKIKTPFIREISVFIFDVFHMWAAITGSNTSIIAILKLYIFGEKCRSIVSSYQMLKCDYITKQIRSFCNSNKSRNKIKWLRLKLNGAIARDIVYNAPYFCCYNCVLADKNETKKNNGNLNSLLMTTIFTIFEDLQYVFSVLWKIKFKVKNDVVPPELIKMRKRLRDASWRAIKILPCMVCI